MSYNEGVGVRAPAHASPLKGTDLTPSLKPLYPQIAESQAIPKQKEYTKICAICKVPQPLSNFHKENRKYGDGHQSYCKTCAPEYHKQWCEIKRLRLEQKLIDETTLRTCTECKISQPLINFEKNIGAKDGRRNVCKTCRAPKKKKYRDDNLEKIREQARTSPVRKAYMKQWYQEHKEEQKEKLKEWKKLYPGYDMLRGKQRRFSQYNVTKEWYDKQLEAQDGGCAICGSKLPRGNSSNTFHIDHNHNCCSNGCNSCGKCVRGLLCSVCNTRLGILEDTEWVAKATAYLAQYKLPAL